MSVGAFYSTVANKCSQQAGNVENPSEENYLRGSTTITKVKYSSFGLIQGYTFAFKKY
jgi:hypothetical protein